MKKKNFKVIKKLNASIFYLNEKSGLITIKHQQKSAYKPIIDMFRFLHLIYLLRRSFPSRGSLDYNLDHYNLDHYNLDYYNLFGNLHSRLS